MAEDSFHHVSLASKINKTFLECSICCGPFNDPRSLPCLHPFCCGCLEKWAKTCSKDGTSVSCPLCEKVYRVPEEEGMKGFPAHFLVATLQEHVDVAKQVCICVAVALTSNNDLFKSNFTITILYLKHNLTQHGQKTLE